MGAKQELFIEKLKEIFQINTGLDFGIYRILNERRKDIDDYIEKKLPEMINNFLDEVKIVSDEDDTQIQELEKKINIYLELEQNEEIINKISKINSQIESLKQPKLPPNIEEEIYDKLYTFFSRYYDEGDFISQRRYKDGAYIVPYNGEEVKLHWANFDQYYIKTDKNFKDYAFDLDDSFSVIFKVQDALVDKDNNKSKYKKVLTLQDVEKPIEIVENSEKSSMIINFSYKQQENITQKEINKNILTSIKELLKDSNISLNIKANISSLVTNKTDKKSIIEYHLERYIVGNKYDYFIHKDLKTFLEHELDFFIKNEVIYLQDLYSASNYNHLEMQIKIASIINAIGKEIITFLSQLEEFQKSLYLKKKFIVDSNYCITLDKIDEKYYKEIIENEKQVQEWIKLFSINEMKGDLQTVGYTNPLTIDFLKDNPYLVLDTCFFSEEFKEKIISEIDNLDDNMNGLLIHGDNFQALNLLQQRYKEQIQCVYIDPPYNTKASEIIYKNKYKHSSWMSLIDSRLIQSNKLMADNSVICIAIDDFEFHRLFNILTNIYSEENYLGTVSVRINPKGRMTARKISAVHEYAIFFGKSYNSNIKKIDENIEDKSHNYKHDIDGSWYLPINLRKQGVDSDAVNKDGTYKERYYPIYYDPKTNKISTTQQYQVKILPIDSKGLKRIWRRGKESIDTMFQENKLWVKKVNGEYQVFFKFVGGLDGKMISSIWYDAKYSASDYGTKILDNILGEREVFSYPKSPYTVMDCILAMSNDNNDTILDFFAGSGTTAHAVINLNREDNGKRKYILVEMGEYFESVTKTRIEKVIYSSTWKEGKPIDRKGSSHIFKYVNIESYEDTLNNIEFSNNLDLAYCLGTKDLIRYKIQKETEKSKIYLPVERFYRPFDFTLKIINNNKVENKKIDLVETFNYLIGLKVVREYVVRYNAEFITNEYDRIVAEVKKANSGAYKFKIVVGYSLKQEKVLVIWRDLVKEDNQKDISAEDINKNNAVLEKVLEDMQIKLTNNEFNMIYINCTNTLQNEESTYQVALIEDVMKEKMFNNME